MRLLPWVLMALLTSGTAHAGEREDRISFVQIFTQQLSEIESIRAEAERQTAGEANEVMSNCVANMTTFQLELRSQIAALKGYQLTGDMKEVPNLISGLYAKKADIYRDIQSICQEFLAGEHPGVDYGALTAKLPEYRARIEFIDKTMMRCAALVLSGLVDMQRTDAQGHLSRLITTRSERDNLLREVNTDFGAQIAAKQSGWIIGTAAVIQGFLEKSEWKNADDP